MEVSVRNQVRDQLLDDASVVQKVRTHLFVLSLKIKRPMNIDFSTNF
jgi:hypothetical protein